MISKECFTSQWIEDISAKLEYNDKNLIEKVIRALSLLEMLVRSGCPLTFKGGTALMLILGNSLHRLSIDIDIICPPGSDIEQYLETYQEHGFIRYQQVNKESAGKDVPVSHAKVFYQIAYTDRSELNEYIRLDVLYEDCPYSNTQELPIDSPFIKLDGEPLLVTVPKKEDILGDKMTAFAPNTIGIHQCLSKRRISNVKELNEELSAWNTERNTAQRGVNWQFTTADARIKLKHLYPILNF